MIPVRVLTGLLLTATLAACTAARPGPEREALLEQYPDTEAPVPASSLLTDDTVLKRHVREYGPAKTMEALVEASHAAGMDCHNRAHEFGRMSFEEFGSDVFKLVLPECHSGFYHGAIEAFFAENGTDELQENLSAICIDGLNGFFTHQCLHGIGHGLMAWSDYDLPATLEYCNLLERDSARSSCRTGVFMENIVGSLDDSTEARARGHVSKYVSDDPHFPCTIVKEAYKGDCYFLQTDRMIELSKSGFEGVARECEKAPAEYHASCFGSMAAPSADGFGATPEAIRNCQFARATENRTECILGAGQDTFWDKQGERLAVEYCALVPETEGKDRCYDMIIARSEEVLKPEDRRPFCELLPEHDKSDCLSNI